MLAWAERTLKRYPHRLALLGFGLLALLFYAPLVLGLRTFPDGDFTHHFLPFSLLQQQALHDFALPLWNPNTYAGHPFLADTQAAVIYPLSNLLLLLSWGWTGAGARLYFLQLEAILHVALAGFFVYLLGQELTRSRPAGLIAGCCFAFSGYLTGYAPLQLAVLRTAIWLPLLLWILLRAFDQPTRWRWWVSAGMVASVIVLAGHPQTWLYCLYTVGAFCLLRLVYPRRMGEDGAQSAAPLGNALPGLAVSLVLALALPAAQLLPSFEFVQLSVRANVDYAFVSGGFPWQDSWQLLLPAVLTQYSPLYIGAVGLGLAILSAGAWLVEQLGRSSRGSRRVYPPYWLFFAGLTLVALLLSYGDNGFLYPLFYRFAPGWNLFRGQERVAFLVTLGLSVLAGYGAAAAPELYLRLRRWLALVALAVTTAGVYGFGLFWQLYGRSAIGNGRYLLIAFVTLALAAALTVVLQRPGWSQRRFYALTALVLINLFWTNLGVNLAPYGPARKTILPPEVIALAGAVAERSTANLGLPGRTYNEFRVYEDFGIRAGLEDVWGSSPLRLARYARLFAEFPLDRLWRLTGVEHLLTWRRELFEPSTLLAEFPQSADSTYLHRLSEPNPRAWLVRQVQPATDEEAAQLLGDHTFNLEQVALLPPEVISTAQDEGAPGPYSVALARPTANRLDVTVTSDQGGLLVVSENWMPGWHLLADASISGTPSGPQSPISNLGGASWAPISNLQSLTVYRANLTLLAVPVPAGAVRFSLVYWPDSVRNGLWISGSVAALLILVAGWRLWGKGWRR